MRDRLDLAISAAFAVDLALVPLLLLALSGVAGACWSRSGT